MLSLFKMLIRFTYTWIWIFYYFYCFPIFFFVCVNNDTVRRINEHTQLTRSLACKFDIIKCKIMFWLYIFMNLLCFKLLCRVGIINKFQYKMYRRITAYFFCPYKIRYGVVRTYFSTQSNVHLTFPYPCNRGG